MQFVHGDYFGGKGKGTEQLSDAQVLWRRSKPPKYPTRYNFTRFAITLNELTPGLKVRWQHPAPFLPLSFLASLV
jgi:oxysterol-binding protein 1